jgi:hypothetical protein
VPPSLSTKHARRSKPLLSAPRVRPVPPNSLVTPSRRAARTSTSGSLRMPGILHRFYRTRPTRCTWTRTVWDSTSRRRRATRRRGRRRSGAERQKCTISIRKSDEADWWLSTHVRITRFMNSCSRRSDAITRVMPNALCFMVTLRSEFHSIRALFPLPLHPRLLLLHEPAHKPPEVVYIRLQTGLLPVLHLLLLLLFALPLINLRQ